MRFLFIFSLLSLLITKESFAQIEAKINEANRSMSKGSFNALVVELPGTNIKEVQKSWSKFIKDYKGKTKYNKKAREYFTDNAQIKGMSDNTIDIYAQFTEKGNNSTELAVWFNLGASYLSSKDFPDRFPAGKTIVEKFVGKVSIFLIEDELEAAEETLEDREDELKKLGKDKEKSEDNIVDYKNDIEKLETKIKQTEEKIKINLEDQEKKRTEIEAQQMVVEEIKKRLDKAKK